LAFAGWALGGMGVDALMAVIYVIIWNLNEWGF
jgi:hypothetical protein